MNMKTAIQRSVARTITPAPPAPGFGGPGHEAVFLVDPADFADQDPFILLADDRLNMPAGAAVGGEHPHAGFEIATYVVQGGIDEGEEGVLAEGDVLWTTAGRGIIHGEHLVPAGPSRILQLWFALPDRERWVEPHVETIRRADAPVRVEEGVRLRLYSGASGDVRVHRREHAPIVMADIEFEPDAVLEQDMPANYNGFLYVLSGSVEIGAGDVLREGQIGWLDRPEVDGPSVVRLAASPTGARLVLYAGQPQNYPIVTHGPFVGGSRADLMRMSREYIGGKYVRLSEIGRQA